MKVAGTICKLFFSTYIVDLQSTVIDSTKTSVFLLFVGVFFSESCKPKSFLAKKASKLNFLLSDPFINLQEFFFPSVWYFSAFLN